MEIFSALLALCVGNSPVIGYSPHKGQALMFSLTCAWTNIWVKNRNACDLRRNHVHNDITVMDYCLISGQQDVETNGAKWIIIWQLFFYCGTRNLLVNSILSSHILWFLVHLSWLMRISQNVKLLFSLGATFVVCLQCCLAMFYVRYSQQHSRSYYSVIFLKLFGLGCYSHVLCFNNGCKQTLGAL